MRGFFDKKSKFLVGISLLILTNTALVMAESLNRGFAWPLNPSHLNPHSLSSDTLLATTKHFLATPLGIDENGQLVPELAREWKINERGDVITLYLREDAVWSDEVKITAKTLEYSLKRALSPKATSDAKPLLFQIKNSTAWASGDKSKPIGIRVIDDYTIELSLEAPSPLFLYALTHTIASAMPMHQLGPLSEPNVLHAGEVLLSSGPYKLVKSDAKTVTFVKNSNYFGKKPYFSNVNFTFDTYKNLLGKYLNGELDILDWIDGKQYQWVKKHKPDDTFMAEDNVPTYIVIGDIVADPVENLLVRKAIQSVIDKQEMEKLLDERIKESQKGIIPWTNKAYKSLELSDNYLWERDQARKMMQQLGYSDSNKLKICMSFYSNRPEELINYIYSHLSNIYIALEVKHIDSLDDTDDDCSIGFGAYNSRVHSEEELIDIFFENGMFDNYRMKDESLLLAYSHMKTVSSVEERLAEVSKIESMLYDKYHVISIQNAPMLSLVKPDIKGYSQSFRFYSIGLSQFLWSDEN